MALQQKHEVKNNSSGNEQGDIHMVLQGIGLEKHFSNIFKKGISWDAFSNMTEEDMIFVGITNLEERKQLIELLNNIRLPNTYYEEAIKLDIPYILEDTAKFIRRLRGSMVYSKNQLQNYNSINTMIDSKTTATKCIQELLQIIEEGTIKLENNLYSALNSKSLNPPENSRCGIFTWEFIKIKCTSLLIGSLFNELLLTIFEN